MGNKEEQIVGSLEKRIEFYRHCMVWTFILGLLSGGSIFCGETVFLIPESFVFSPITIKVLFCSFIAMAGIATGSGYRRRIRLLKDCRDKILMELYNQRFFPNLAREGIITEMQVLFGILFLLSLVIVCIQYPVPKMPAFLDSNLVRMVPVLGFLGLFCISVWPERKDPIQDLLERQNIHISLGYNRTRFLQTYMINNGDSRKSGVSRLPRKRSGHL